MAPELLKDAKIKSHVFGPITEIYSLGVIQYCLVTGEHPYDADDIDGVYNLNRKGKINLNRATNKKLANAS